MKQLPLFPEEPKQNNPLELLRNGAELILSVSGGKDSDAMSHYLLDLRQEEGWSGNVCMVHADLGRAEWHNTSKYVENLAKRKKLDLHVVRYSHGDLIDRIWHRYSQDPSRPCWPSPAIRYCTSDLKVAPISRFIRQNFASGQVICSTGLRAGESRARAKKDKFSARRDSTAVSKGRFVWNWYPIHDWSEEGVWDCIREHGNIFHPAYSLETPNQRLSCSLCIMGSLNDLINGAVENPDVYREYCRIEAVTGYSFRPKFWLSDIKPQLLPESSLIAVRRHKNTA